MTEFRAAPSLYEAFLAFNRQAFADPCDVRGLRRPCGIFGNLGGFLLDNPGSVFYDLSVFKNIKLGERRALQFRAELFNIFNHTNFSGPGSTLTGATLAARTNAGNGEIITLLGM